uniref:Uncharacterized protein n=1 Tax=viral metagenome TaxID=1070528 RepID=A0A6C0LYV4_9ZZZZ
MEYQYASPVYDSQAKNCCDKKKYKTMADAYPKEPQLPVEKRNCAFAPFNGSGSYYLVTEGYGKCQ